MSLSTKRISKYLTVKQAVATSLSVVLSLMVLSLEIKGEYDVYILPLMLLFCFYLVLWLFESLPRIVNHFERRADEKASRS
jgi:preprotein translocase subunit SecY